MAIQVQMRGGTSAEHENFIGAPREVTVDTTFNTLRVHDGVTPGGNPLTTVSEFIQFKKEIFHEIEGIQNDISQTHDHDDRYAKIVHSHDEYVNKVDGTKGLLAKNLNGYDGVAFEDGSDTNWIRTTKNGLIPYQSGGYSSIGSSSWRFNNGFFNTVDSNNIKINGGELKLASSACINFNNDDRLTYDDSANEFQLSSDGEVSKSRLCLGHIELNGTRLYIGSAFPSNARVNDILIKI